MPNRNPPHRHHLLLTRVIGPFILTRHRRHPIIVPRPMTLGFAGISARTDIAASERAGSGIFIAVWEPLRARAVARGAASREARAY